MHPYTHVPTLYSDTHHTQYVTRTQSRNYQHALPHISAVVGYSTVSISGTPSFHQAVFENHCKEL